MNAHGETTPCSLALRTRERGHTLQLSLSLSKSIGCDGIGCSWAPWLNGESVISTPEKRLLQAFVLHGRAQFPGHLAAGVRTD